MAKVEDTPENASVCLEFCGPCPTFPEVEGEALFCARGKSIAPKQKHGCNCTMCTVQGKSGCRGTYYCINDRCE
ncbi:MAG: DUF2769 domain-containing protein [Nitrospirae bacterium]|nr:DUF2769 domain-containing protein [Nitrospirota bacterium]